MQITATAPSNFFPDMPEMQIGIFPYEGQMVTGVIVKAGGYQPSGDGVTIYFKGGDNLQVILDKVEKTVVKSLFKKHGTQMKVDISRYSLIQKEIRLGFIPRIKPSFLLKKREALKHCNLQIC